MQGRFVKKSDFYFKRLTLSVLTRGNACFNLNQLSKNFEKYTEVIRKCNVKVTCIEASNALLDLMSQNMTNVNDMMYVDFDELDSNKTQTLPHFDNSEFNNTTHRTSGYIFLEYELTLISGKTTLTLNYNQLGDSYIFLRLFHLMRNILSYIDFV